MLYGIIWQVFDSSGLSSLGAVLITCLGVVLAQDWRRNDQWERQTDHRNERYVNRNKNYGRQEMGKGYRAGLDRGRQDARTNRSRTLNNFSH